MNNDHAHGIWAGVTTICILACLVGAVKCQEIEGETRIAAPESFRKYECVAPVNLQNIRESTNE